MDLPPLLFMTQIGRRRHRRPSQTMGQNKPRFHRLLIPIYTSRSSWVDLKFYQPRHHEKFQVSYGLTHEKQTLSSKHPYMLSIVTSATHAWFHSQAGTCPCITRVGSKKNTQQFAKRLVCSMSGTWASLQSKATKRQNSLILLRPRTPRVLQSDDPPTRTCWMQPDTRSTT